MAEQLYFKANVAFRYFVIWLFAYSRLRLQRLDVVE